jgi:hypothetical protein
LESLREPALRISDTRILFRKIKPPEWRFGRASSFHAPDCNSEKNIKKHPFINTAAMLNFSYEDSGFFNFKNGSIVSNPETVSFSADRGKMFGVPERFRLRAIKNNFFNNSFADAGRETAKLFFGGFSKIKPKHKERYLIPNAFFSLVPETRPEAFERRVSSENSGVAASMSSKSSSQESRSIKKPFTAPFSSVRLAMPLSKFLAFSLREESGMDLLQVNEFNIFFTGKLIMKY